MELLLNLRLSGHGLIRLLGSRDGVVFNLELLFRDRVDVERLGALPQLLLDHGLLGLFGVVVLE